MKVNYLLLFLMFFINGITTTIIYILLKFLYEKIKNYLHRKKVEKFLKDIKKVSGKFNVEFVDDKNIFKCDK